MMILLSIYVNSSRVTKKVLDRNKLHIELNFHNVRISLTDTY